MRATRQTGTYCKEPLSTYSASAAFPPDQNNIPCVPQKCSLTTATERETLLQSQAPCQTVTIQALCTANLSDNSASTKHRAHCWQLPCSTTGRDHGASARIASWRQNLSFLVTNPGFGFLRRSTNTPKLFFFRRVLDCILRFSFWRLLNILRRAGEQSDNAPRWHMELAILWPVRKRRPQG